MHDAAREQPVSKAYSILQVRLDPELKRILDGYCASVQRSQSFVVERAIRNLTSQWRDRLLPETLPNELNHEELQA
jgi:predicted transcriptional regulator